MKRSETGTVVEVEYVPCTLASVGGTVLDEFLDWLLAEEQPAAFRSSEINFARVQSLPSHFGCQHAALQFVAMLQTAHSVGTPT